MTHRRSLLAVAVLLPVLLAGGAWAEEEGMSPSQPVQPQPMYPAGPQPVSPAIPDASANIIGYQPISNDALDAALAGAAAAPAMAQPAYPAVAVTVAGLPSQPATAAGGPSAAQLPPAYVTGILGDGPYTLGRDDAIHVDVRNQAEFSGNFVVGFDGRIQYTYLGDIPVAGLTKYEVQQVLEQLLQQYVRVPSVNVTIVAYNSKVVYVIGEVSRPGKFVMRGDAIKLREAILAAGLPTPRAALRRVHVIKPDLDTPRVRVINMKRILYKGRLKDDVDLSPGEIVVVPSTVWSTVNTFLGQLLNPVTRFAASAALAGI